MKNFIYPAKIEADEDVYDITFDGTWMSFEKQHINLNEGQQDFITFTVRPQILTSNQTNHTYTYDIVITSENTAQYRLPINIFIPYSEFIENNQTGYDPVAYPLSSLETVYTTEEYTGTAGTVVLAQSTGGDTFNTMLATDVYDQYTALPVTDGLVGNAPSEEMALPREASFQAQRFLLRKIPLLITSHSQDTLVCTQLLVY